MKVVVTNDGTMGRSELKFMGVVRMKVWPTGTIENPKVGVIRCGSEKTMYWSVIVYVFGWS
jgi:hypothetical protein